MSELGGLGEYVGGGVDSLAEDLAEAWLVLSRIEDGDGKTTRMFPEELPAYLRDDWAKDAQRRIRGYAETHERPRCWPWNRPEFDHFRWASGPGHR